jgi:hypothetical protein
MAETLPRVLEQLERVADLQGLRDRLECGNVDPVYLGIIPQTASQRVGQPRLLGELAGILASQRLSSVTNVPSHHMRQQ